jgi:hypothetical protein
MFRRRIENWKDAAATRRAPYASNDVRVEGGAIQVVIQEFWSSISASIGWTLDS